jgi:hypothetical protein
VSFLTAFQKYVPSWLSKGEGGLVGSSLAQQMEDMRVRAKLALVARFPEYAATYVDDAALAAIGRDRRIVRGINEPAASYAARLVRAIDDHRTQGNPYTMLRQIQAYLQARCVVRTVDRRGNWYSLDGDGNASSLLKTGNWDWDGRAASPEWARFWVIIYPEDGIKPWRPSGLWGDATLWGDGLWGHADKCIGLTATPDQMSSLKSIIRDWKPAGTTCEWMIVAFDPDTFDPAISMDINGEWGTWGNHTGGPVRLETARYIAVGATTS